MKAGLFLEIGKYNLSKTDAIGLDCEAQHLLVKMDVGQVGSFSGVDDDQVNAKPNNL